MSIRDFFSRLGLCRPKPYINPWFDGDVWDRLDYVRKHYPKSMTLREAQKAGLLSAQDITTILLYQDCS